MKTILSILIITASLFLNGCTKEDNSPVVINPGIIEISSITYAVTSNNVKLSNHKITLLAKDPGDNNYTIVFCDGYKAKYNSVFDGTYANPIGTSYVDINFSVSTSNFKLTDTNANGNFEKNEDVDVVIVPGAVNNYTITHIFTAPNAVCDQ